MIPLHSASTHSNFNYRVSNLGFLFVSVVVPSDVVVVAVVSTVILLDSITGKIEIRVTESSLKSAVTVVVAVVVAAAMGCGGSKLEEEQQNQVLVKLCRERKHLLKSAADHRFALAAAHVSYFRQLSEVGNTLWKFVEEELVLLSTSSSSTPSSISSISSPVLTIPSDHFKSSEKKKNNDNVDDGGSRNSHLHWSSSDELDSLEGNIGEFDGSYGKNEHQNHHHGKNMSKNREEKAGKQKEKQKQSGSGGSPQPGISYIPDPDPSTNLGFSSYGDPSTSYGYPTYYGGSSYVGDSGFNSNSNSNSNYPEYNGDYNNYNYPASSSYYNGGSNSYNDVSGSSYGFGPNSNANVNGTSYTSYYMKKSSTRIPSVIYEEPKYVNNPIYSFSDSQGYGYHNVVNSRQEQQRQQQPQQKVKAPTPPSPKVSAWDYFNPFESFESGGVGSVRGGFYGGAELPGMYGNGYVSNSSSPDSREVREREGIPDLEEETETEVSFPSSTKKVGPRKGGKSVHFQDHVHDIPLNNKGKRNYNTNNVRNSGRPSSSSRRSNANVDEGNSRRTPFVEPEPELEAFDEEKDVEDSSLSPETEASVATISTSAEDHEHDHDLGQQHEKERVYVKKKGVSFDMEGAGGSSHEVQSSMPSSLTTLSADGTRDLREVVREIKDEFEAATDYGKEVSTLLEVGREPYRSRSTFLKVMLAKVCSSSLQSTHSPSGIATGYPEERDNRSLAATLDKLYVWENKLYKEVKDEEKLRLMYEKQCRKLKTLDEHGAESSKVEATQFSIRKLLTQINVSVRAVDSISSRIHKLRDEELQPQLKELIYGLRKMWKLMLKCHQRQFQAILESKTRALRANTGLRKDSSVRATIQLEAELLKWCQRFNNWIDMQRSYAKTLNGWLERCIHYEPEVTSDGVMPLSPGRIGAPPIFVICHDWKQAMERVSESEVQTAMNDFAASLHQLWERQDEEQRRRLKAENVYKDFEKQIRATRVERQRKGHNHDDAFSDKNSLSIVASDSGISPLDDLKVDLDSMRLRVKEERAGHKEAVKLVHDAVSRSIQSGLIPIFESLESFTSEAFKALDDVRLEYVTVSS